MELYGFHPMAGAPAARATRWCSHVAAKREIPIGNPLHPGPNDPRPEQPEPRPPGPEEPTPKPPKPEMPPVGPEEPRLPPPDPDPLPGPVPAPLDPGWSAGASF